MEAIAPNEQDFSLTRKGRHWRRLFPYLGRSATASLRRALAPSVARLLLSLVVVGRATRSKARVRPLTCSAGRGLSQDACEPRRGPRGEWPVTQEKAIPQPAAPRGH